jgi:protein-disulfide isomerase
MTKRQLLVLGVCLLLILLGGGTWLYFQNAADVTASSAGTPADTISGEEWHTMGNPKAKVTLIEYGAHTCPICAYFNEHTFADLKTKYIDTGKVFYAYRLLPIDPADGKAAEIADCLPGDKYFAFVDLLYRRQDEWGPEQMGEHGMQFDAAHQPRTDAGLLKMARAANLDDEKAKACLASTKLQGRINAIAEDAGSRYGIHSTPTLIVNGQVFQAGARTLDELSGVIDPLL